MSAPILDLEVHTYIRSETTILHDVAWRIEQGQHWALLGANGCGKSTLLNVVAGYEWPSSGRVALLGNEYGECYMPDLKKRIGLVSAALYARLWPRELALDVAASGLHAVIGPYRRYGEKEHAAGQRALDRIRVGHLAGRPYGVLSQGEKQRVMIARALVREPDLLILDEPCSGLDPVAREAFLDDVAALCGAPDGPTLLFVTHHIEEVPELITHALVLREGTVLAAGPKAEVLTDETMSAAFGAPCHVSLEAGRYALRVKGG